MLWHSIKVKKYESLFEAEGMAFVPLAVDTFERWHRVALEAIGKLGRQLARVVLTDEGEDSPATPAAARRCADP